MRLELLGEFEARDVAGERIALSSRKAAALLAYAAVQGGRPVSRDKLAGLLWGESAEPQARSSLRQALTVLRRRLPEEVLRTDAHTVASRPEALDVDALEVERFLDDGSAESVARAALLYRGDLLDGFHPRAPGFEDWLVGERARLRERVSAALGAVLASEADPHRAIRLAVRALALDPLQESVHRLLMERYARVGRRGAALRQFRICKDILDRELGVAPSADTLRLRDSIAVRSSSSPVEIARADAGSAPVDQPDPELRQATVVIAGLADEGAAEGAEDRLRSHARHDSVVRRAVEERGGLVIREMGDAIMAAFGAVRARRRDPELAVLAATRVHRRLREASVAARIGIADGQVMVTRQGADVQLVGRPVSVAAALEASAEPGEIRVTASIQKSVADRADTEPVAGDRGVPEAFRVCAVREGAGSDTGPFVGRDPELRQIRAALDGVRETKRGHAVLLRGEAGLGKTRLLERLEAEAQARQFDVHRALVLDFGVSRGKGAVAELARSLLDLPTDALPEEGRAAAEEASRAGILGADELVFLNDLLDLQQPTELLALYDAMEDAARRRGTRTVLAKLVAAAAAPRPALITVDDIHWADGRTLSHLHEIVAAVAERQALLIMTTRVEEEPDTPWRRAPARGPFTTPFTTIDLAPLREDEARTLAAAYGVSGERLERCVDEADGNPLFLDQLLRAGDEDGGLPGTIHSLVLARMDALSARDRRALQAASVLGQRFTAGELARVANDPRYEPRPLVDRALIQPADQPGGDGYLFAHALVREVVYASLLDEPRLALHRRAAATVVENDPELRAVHLDRARAPEAPAAYLDAARHRAADYHPARALDLAERGRALADDPALWFQLATLRADLLRDLGRVEASVAGFREAVEHARDDGEVATAAFGVAAGHRQADRDRDALEELDRAEAAAERVGLQGRVGQIRHLRGNLYFPRGDGDRCLQEQERALAIARELGSARDEAKALSGLGDAEYLRGHMNAAYAHFDRSIELARAHGFGRIEVANLHMRGLTRLYQLKTAGALEDCLEGLQKTAVVGNRRAEMVTNSSLGLVRLLRAEWEALEAEQRECARLADELGARRFAAIVPAYLGFMLCERGRTREGIEELRRSAQLTRDAGAEFAAGGVYGLFAAAAPKTAERDGALGEAETLLGKGAISHNHLQFRPLAMLACWRAGDPDGLERNAAAFERWAGPRRIACVDFFVRWGRALAVAARGAANPAELRGLRDRAEAAQVRLALGPLDEVLRAAT